MSQSETIEERIERRRAESHARLNHYGPVHVWNHESWKQRAVDFIDTVRAEYQTDCNEYIDSLVRKGVVSYA